MSLESGGLLREELRQGRPKNPNVVYSVSMTLLRSLKHRLRAWAWTAPTYRLLERIVLEVGKKHRSAPLLVLLAPVAARHRLVRVHQFFSAHVFHVDQFWRRNLGNRLVLWRVSLLFRYEKPIPVKLIKGWKESYSGKLRPRSSTIDAAGGVAVDAAEGPVYVAGILLRFEICQDFGAALVQALTDGVREKIPFGYPLQLVKPFTLAAADGNFNSAKPAKFSLGSFRDDPEFSYLTPARRVNPLLSEYFFLGIDLHGLPPESLHVASRALASGNKDPRRDSLAAFHNDVTHWFFSAFVLELARGAGLKVIEIGGGYGGLARRVLMDTSGAVSSYTIVDIAKTLSLAKRFLKKELPASLFRRVQFLEASSSPAGSPRVVGLVEAKTIGIATHSLSELDPAQMNSYLETVLPECDYFLLSYQRFFSVNGADTEWLLARLLREFTLRHTAVTEGGSVVTAFLQKKVSQSL